MWCIGWIIGIVCIWGIVCIGYDWIGNCIEKLLFDLFILFVLFSLSIDKNIIYNKTARNIDKTGKEKIVLPLFVPNCLNFFVWLS